MIEVFCATFVGVSGPIRETHKKQNMKCIIKTIMPHRSVTTIRTKEFCPAKSNTWKRNKLIWEGWTHTHTSEKQGCEEPCSPSWVLAFDTTP